MQIYVDMRCCT